MPLVADDEPVGLALLSDRARGRFGKDEHAAALDVADFAAIAVKNARRFQALERVGLRDRDTGAYNLAYFVDYAGKEFYKARRYGRAFSLVILSIDNAEQLRKEARARALPAGGARPRGRRLAASCATRTSSRRSRESEYYVLLPETDYFGALMFLRRAAEEVRREASIRAARGALPAAPLLGAATFPKDGEDFDELLHWARARVQEQRGSLLRRLHLDDLAPAAFWELADLLLADDGAPPRELAQRAPRRGDAELFAAAQREAAREIGARPPRARASSTSASASGSRRRRSSRGAPAGRRRPPGPGTAPSASTCSARGGAGPSGAAHPLVTEVPLDGDARLADHDFLLFLSEHSAYGAPRRARRADLPHLRHAAGGRAGLEAPGALRPPAALASHAHGPRPEDPHRRPRPRGACARSRRRCGSAGYQVHAARDGVARAPDRHPPLPRPGPARRGAARSLDARTFIRILRTNPRTEHIPVVLTGERARRGARPPRHLPPEAVQPGRGARPRRAAASGAQDASRAVSGEGREIEGNLAQIPLVDLLQILAVNRKTGRLALEREGERAEIVLREGRVIDARVGRAGGEKALFRLLTRREGQFAFVPGHDATAERDRAQGGRAGAGGAPPGRRGGAPAPGAPAAGRRRSSWRSTRARSRPGLHPVTEEVVALLERPLAFQELRRPLPRLGPRGDARDGGAARARLRAVPRGRAGRASRRAPRAARAARAPRADRARAGPPGAQTVGKVVVAGRRSAGAPRGARALRGRCPGSRRRRRRRRRVRHARPARARRRRAGGPDRACPATPACCRSGGRSPPARWARWCCSPPTAWTRSWSSSSRVLRLPVVVCGPKDASLPQALREAPGGCAFEGSDAAEGLRALLAGAGARAAGY